VRASKKTRLKYTAAATSDEYTLYEVKGDRMPIGISDVMDKFTLHEIDLLKGDVLYMFSDGFADQFGGPSGKKFQYGNFRNILISNCSKSMAEQKQILDKTFENWKGDLSQVDDVLVVGIRIN
jgi:serine phosphatase RsbU (regulator of sigma subunit)